MDKTTRLLLLYSRLVKGEKINRASYCLEMDISTRTFDRDIKDFRYYLMQIFSTDILLFSRQEGHYYLIEAQPSSIELYEYLLIERILLDTGVLRRDEVGKLLSKLVFCTENPKSLSFRQKENTNLYSEPLHNKAILKMHGDLVTAIINKMVIKLDYIKSNGEVVEREVVPCNMKYDLGYLYLTAFLLRDNKDYPAYFRVDRIISFKLIRNQSVLEKQCVLKFLEKHSKGLIQMYGGDFVEIQLLCTSEFFPYVHDKFRDLTILEKHDDVTLVQIKAFEDGFVKWLLSQPSELVQVIKPRTMQLKILSEIDKIKSRYEVLILES